MGRGAGRSLGRFALLGLGLLAGASAAVAQTTTTAVSSNRNPSEIGQYVTFQANVSAAFGTPYGWIYFYGPNFASQPLPLQATGNFTTSTASWVATNLSSGSYPVGAYYYYSTSGHQLSIGNVFQSVQDTYFVPTSTQLLTSSNPVSVSSDVTFTAQIASFPEATGMVDFYRVDALYGPILLGSSQASQLANVTQATLTIPASGLGVGSHQIDANFLGGWSGNFSFRASTGILTQEVVFGGLTPTSTYLYSSPNPSIQGQIVFFTAYVSASSGSPTGQVRFKDGAATLGLANVTYAGPNTGQAALNVPLFDPGYHQVTAEYEPTGAFAPSNSSLYQQVVPAVSPTTTSVFSHRNPSEVGQYVKFQADVSASAGTPFGYVYFYGPNFASPSLSLQATGNFTSTVSWVATNLSSGSYPVGAYYYNSTSGHDPSFGDVFQTVQDTYFVPTSTQLLTSANPASVSSDVTFTAQIASFPEATGMVDFYRVDATLGPILLGSSQASLLANVTQASLTIPASGLGVGYHEIHANFLGGWSGNFSFRASTGILTQQVVAGGLAPTSTYLYSSPNPSMSGQTVFFTAYVSSTVGSPTGQVRFKDGALTLGLANVTYTGQYSGQAALNAPLFDVGNHSLTAEYLPTGAFAPSNSSTTHVVVPPSSPTTTFVFSYRNPSELGQYVKFQADVSASAGTPYGYVYFSGPNFTSPSLPLQTTGNVTSTVSWVATNLSLGFYPVSAYYSSTSGHQPSFGNVFQNVMDSYFIPTSTQLLTSSNPASVSSDVTFTAQIASFPEATGTVDFYRVDATFGPILMGSSQASLVANVTQASFTIPASALGVGSHQIHANFLGGWSGNFSFQASTGILTQDVVSGLAPTITSLASDPNPSTSGQTVLFTAFVSSTAGSPTGLVRFSDGAQTLGFGNVTPNGPFTALATLSVPLVGVGNHSVTAEYLPTGAFAGSNSSVLVQQVQSAPPFLAISDVSVVEGNTATSTATFVVTLSAAQGTDVTVGYTTGGGTATAGSDYLASSGTVTFAAGQTTRPVDLTIVGDTTYEPDETFEVTLSSPVGAVIGDGVGVGTILNDDPPPGPSRVFVSVDGLDTNDCSNVLTPCRTLNAAIAQVAEHGEVIIIKSGSYAGATITKSVKVTAAAGVVAFSGQPITVNAGASAIVAIRGLTLKAVTPGTGNGLLIQSAAAVFLENSVIDGWAVGVYRAGAAEAFIKDSVIRNNGTGLFATGKTTVENTRLSNNSIGIATSLSKLSLRGSTVSGSASEGILADLQSDVSVEKCQISNNGVGVKLPLATSHVRLSRSVVSGNGIGLENVAGMLEVSGNNVIRGNSTNTSGAVTFVPLQ